MTKCLRCGVDLDLDRVFSIRYVDPDLTKPSVLMFCGKPCAGKFRESMIESAGMSVEDVFIQAVCPRVRSAILVAEVKAPGEPNGVKSMVFTAGSTIGLLGCAAVAANVRNQQEDILTEKRGDEEDSS